MTIIPGALLFDMDGLMVDSEPLWFEAERDLARELGSDWTHAEAQASTGTGLRAVVRTITTKAGARLTVDEGVAVLTERFVARIDRLQLKPGCRELIEIARAARVPIAVASSNERWLVETILGRFDLVSSFAAIVSGSDVKNAKPAPDIFLEAAARLGVVPAKCVVLEDALAGATAGHAAGMVVIAVPEGTRDGFAAVATHVVADLFAARALLSFEGATE